LEKGSRQPMSSPLGARHRRVFFNYRKEFLDEEGFIGILHIGGYIAADGFIWSVYA
jgi:hypothetical protein